MSQPPCPKCQSEYTYLDGQFITCPECGHEWQANDNNSANEEESEFVMDANGNKLFAGDSATLAKSLKVKGSSTVLKIGTKIKINRIVDGDHNIDCKVEKVGPMMLKSEFVKKS